jgi:hypothetical protein
MTQITLFRHTIVAFLHQENGPVMPGRRVQKMG